MGASHARLRRPRARRAPRPPACSAHPAPGPHGCPRARCAPLSPGARPRRLRSSRTMISSNERAAIAPNSCWSSSRRSPGMPMTPIGRAPSRSGTRARRRDAVAARPTTAHRQVDELGQPAHAVDVVAVVDDDLEALDVELVEATGRLEEATCVNVRRPWRMSWRCAPAAHAAPAAASALATFIRARPSSVAGMRCV